MGYLAGGDLFIWRRKRGANHSLFHEKLTCETLRGMKEAPSPPHSKVHHVPSFTEQSHLKIPISSPQINQNFHKQLHSWVYALKT